MQTNPERFWCKTYRAKGAQEVASPPVVCISLCWVTVSNYIYFLSHWNLQFPHVICSGLCLFIQAHCLGFIFWGVSSYLMLLHHIFLSHYKSSYLPILAMDSELWISATSYHLPGSLCALWGVWSRDTPLCP